MRHCKPNQRVAVRHALLLATVLVFAAGAAPAATYYVDFDGGADAGGGTAPDRAWKHSPGDPAAEGNAKTAALKAGDAVVFKGGVVYRGQVKVAWSGAEGKPITFDGNTAGTFGEGRAVIDGSEPLTDWQRCRSADECGGNPNWKHLVWTRAPSDSEPFSANLYQGDRMLWPAQDPNLEDPFYYDDYDGYRRIPAGGATPTTVVDPAYFNQKDPGAWNGAVIAILGKPMYVRFLKVTGYEPSSGTIRYERMPAAHYIDTHPRLARYAMLNALRILDRPGEYVYTPQADADGRPKVTLWPPEDDVATHPVTLSRRHTGIDLASHSHVTIQGLVIQKFLSSKPDHRGSGISCDAHGADRVTVRDNHVRFCHRVESSWKHAGINLAGTTHALVEGNRVHENRRCGGIYILGGTHCTVRNNHVERDGYQGIWMMGAKHSVVTGNTVLNNLAVHSNGISTYSGCDDVLVRDNRVINSNAPFTSGQSSNITIAYNVFSGSRVADWGKCRNLRFLNNVILTTGDDAQAVYIARNSPDVVLRNNIIGGGILDASVRHDHNIWTAQSRRAVKPGTGGIEEHDLAKLFVDPAKHDYRLRAGSPAIDAGADVGLAEDAAGAKVPQGRAPDIGAFEYRAEATPSDER